MDIEKLIKELEKEGFKASEKNEKLKVYGFINSSDENIPVFSLVISYSNIKDKYSLCIQPISKENKLYFATDVALDDVLKMTKAYMRGFKGGKTYEEGNNPNQ